MSVQIILSKDIYLDSTVLPVTLPDPLYAGDAGAQRIRFRCFQRHGQIVPVDMSGETISAHFIRPDGGDVVITGTAGTEWAWVDLPEACYAYPGPFKLLIRASTREPDVMTSILYITGTIDKPTTDVIIDPGTTIPSLEDLLAQMDACEAATEGAVEAAGNANSALDYLAEVYSAEADYAVGSYCVYDSKLYRCVEAITGGGEAWTAAHWMEVTFAGDISMFADESPNLFDPRRTKPFNSKAVVQATDTGVLVEGVQASDYINAMMAMTLKPATEYWFCVKKHVYSGIGRVSYSEIPDGGSSYPSQLITIVAATQPDDVWIKVKFTTTTGLIRFRFHVTWDTAAEGRALFDDIMVCEGEPEVFYPCVFARDAEARHRLDGEDLYHDTLEKLNGGSLSCGYEYTAEKQTYKSAVKVYAGYSYYLYTTTDIGETRISVYVGGDSSNLVRLTAGGMVQFDPAIDGYLWFFNGAGGYVGQADFVALPFRQTEIMQWPEMITSAARLARVTNGTNALADLPANTVVCLGSSSATNVLTDPPFAGGFTILTAYRQSNGVMQVAVGRSCTATRWKSGGAWLPWQVTQPEQTYYVGGDSGNDSFTAMLLSLRNNSAPKVIYIHEGVYDMFAEYMDEVDAGNLEIPPDDIANGSYFYPYNAFVPTNTRIIGLGNVVLKMEPEADEITYGASRTWSPLNIYGSVEIENVTVKAHNCRYCLHNDDHNAYENSRQVYRHCRFLYRYSDTNGSGQLLGFNTSVGFGIQKDSTHIFDGCEMYNESEGNESVFYGHESTGALNGSIILRNCVIHSSNFSNARVIRFQSLAHSQGHVRVWVENCYINGGVRYHMYYADSPQNFEVTFVTCNKVPLTRNISDGGTIVDPYTTRWINPLPAPTAEDPLIEYDTYPNA